MAESDDLRAVRAYFNLTQSELAEWLGVHRTQVAHAENGQRALPLRATERLTPLNLCVDRATGAGPMESPTPTYLAPLVERLSECRFEAARLTHALGGLGTRAQPLANRLAALPALRAALPDDPEGEKARRWLTRLFESEATDELAAEAGPLSQGLLAARLAACEVEIARLEELRQQWSAAARP